MLSYKAAFLFIHEWFINVDGTPAQTAWFTMTSLVVFQLVIFNAMLKVLCLRFK
jgi:hypothetical protein